MAEKVDGRYTLTAETPMIFPALHEPRKSRDKQGREQGEPKYSGLLSFAEGHPDLDALKALAVKIGKAKWPDRDIVAEFKAGRFKLPFDSGTRKADEYKAKKPGDETREWQRGKCLVPTHSGQQFPPQLCEINGGKLVVLEGAARIAAKPKFYSGVKVLAQVNFVAYDGVSNNPDGVTAYLQMVLTTGKGDRIAGGQDATEVFKAYMGNLSQVDPTKGATVSDDIPF